MIVGGVILLIIAAICGGVSYASKKKIYQLRTVDKRNCGDVMELAREVVESMAEFGGSESLVSEVGEFVGDLVCEAPITGELSGQQCVYYKMSVIRKYEETYWDKDANEHKTRTGTTTVSTNSNHAAFALRDSTGELPVDASKCKWEGLVQSVSKFERSGYAPQVSFGGFTFSVGNDHRDTDERRTIGYEYKEHIMPVGKRVTVIGEVTDKMGQIALRTGDKMKLSISTKSREEQLESARKTQKYTMIAAIACGALGAVLAVIGAVS